MQKLIAALAVVALPTFAFGLYWVTRPFPDTLSSVTISMRELSGAQRINIQQAARALNGAVIEPGRALSFNKEVGPRSSQRGYVSAPSYVGNDSIATVGGGVCLVSSGLYQTALRSGMKIDKRTPHLRTIKTVPPGLDATVWYGQTDLVFTNSLSQPVQIKCESSPVKMTLSILGPRSALPSCKVYRKQFSTPSGIQAEVYRQIKGRVQLVSRDNYESRHEPKVAGPRITEPRVMEPEKTDSGVQVNRS